MKTVSPRKSKVAVHRKALKRLTEKLQKRPFDFLPERSVEALKQFFAGYGIFGSPIYRDLASFNYWLSKRLFYPNDSGECWWRRIQLNSKDKFHGWELFFEVFSEYCNQKPVELEPGAPDFETDPAKFDFYLHLYNIGQKPGLYLGSGGSVQMVAAYLAGYFEGKKEAGLKLTEDEKEFSRFEKWLCRSDKLRKHYPWHQVIEMWPNGGRNSFESFFAMYDAYLTDYGKKPRGFEELFKVTLNGKRRTIRRRTKREVPKKLVRIGGTRRWWRMTAADVKTMIQSSRGLNLLRARQ